MDTLQPAVWANLVAVATNLVVLATPTVLTDPDSLAVLTTINMVAWYSLPNDVRTAIISRLKEGKASEVQAYVETVLGNPDEGGF